MKHIIYHSTASIYFRPEMLDNLVVKFNKNNSEKHVTGLLLYSKGSFLQLIEGDDQQIDQLMRKIHKDKIHHSLIILAQSETAFRIFPSWSMGYKSVSEKQFAAIKQLLQPDATGSTSADQNHPVLNYIRNFAADSLNIHKLEKYSEKSA